MTKLQSQFKEARRAAVPLLLITTADPADTIRTVCEALNGKTDDLAIMQHDCIRGLIGAPGSEVGAAIASQLAPGGPADTGNPIQCLDLLYNALSGTAGSSLKKAVLFMLNAHKPMQDAGFQQAVWNLRDPFSQMGATLVLLGATPNLPVELKQDVIVLEDPFPTPQQITESCVTLAQELKEAGAPIDPDEIAKDEALADTLTGISRFGVQQVFAMSATRSGLNRAGLFERKRKLIEQTPGLQVWEGAESFDDLGGLENLKTFLTNLLTSGKTPVRAIGFIDEIEKSLAAAGTDTSGTSQDQLSVFLRVMQDDNLPGIILIGPPGTGKSAIAKASGKIANAPVIAMDLGAAKGSLVGQSEERIRSMLSVFQAVSQGKGLFIATCNGIAALPPELRRRFKLGTFFVDLPDAGERKRIWSIGRKRFNLEDQPLPACDGWSGAEIVACCECAYRMSKTIAEAANFIVPASVSAGDKITELRRSASGRYISANKPGLYRYAPSMENTEKTRAMEV